MSIAVMTEVWRRSQHSGSYLLMMLALADFSDDSGCSYPAVSTLATKCRMQSRNANVVLAALRESGELEVRHNAGPKGVNRYRIVLKALGGVQSSAGMQGLAGVQTGAGDAKRCTLQGHAATPAKACSRPLQPVADEPSLNRQETSDTSPARLKAPKLPKCPFAEIVAAYHNVLPELPAVRLLDSGDRKTKTATFWNWVFRSEKVDGTKRANDTTEALAWIRAYFTRARSNDFLMGRGERSGPHANWRCDFDFLLTSKGMRHVIEKTEATA